MRHVLMLTAMAALALAGCKPKPAAPSAESLTLGCAAPFTADASAASLAAHFGAANVVEQIVPGPEGTEMTATLIFPNDPKRRLEVVFADETARRGLLNARTADAATLWTIPAGIALGAQLAEVEKINGKPFTLTGFDWDYAGYVTDWQGGALDQQQAGCRIGVRFDRPADSSDQTILGDGDFGSDLPAMQAAKAFVSEISIGYPQEIPPEAVAP